MSHTHEFVITEAEKTRCSKQKLAHDNIMAEAEEMSSFLAGMGQRCDPELQEELREFVQTQGDDGRELAWCLGPESARPLWQLGLLGLLANKGLIMLSTDNDYDAQLITLSESVLALVSAPVAEVGLPVAAVDDGSSPYLDTEFESELAALALTADCL